jgi:hypothetical protein
MPKLRSHNLPSTNKIHHLRGSFQVESIEPLSDPSFDKGIVAPLSGEESLVLSSNVVASSTGSLKVDFINGAVAAGVYSFTTRTVTEYPADAPFDLELSFQFNPNFNTGIASPLIRFAVQNFNLSWRAISEDRAELTFDSPLLVDVGCIVPFDKEKTNYIRIHRSGTFIGASAFDRATMKWVEVCGHPVYNASLPQTPITVTMQGDSTPAGNGSFSDIRYKEYPCIQSVEWVDLIGASRPVCTSKNLSQASFICKPLVIGTIDNLSIFGCGAQAGVSLPIPSTVEVTTAPHPNTDISLSVSQIQKFFTNDVPPSVCPLRGIPSRENFGGAEILNRCFQDSSPQDETPVVVEVTRPISRNNATPITDSLGVVFNSNGGVYGDDHDLKPKLLKNVPEIDDLEGPTAIRLMRALTLSNNDILYYGATYVPVKNAVMRVTAATDGSSANNILRLYQDGIAIALDAISFSLSQTVAYDLPLGSYYLVIDKGDDSTRCNITIEISYDGGTTFHTVSSQNYVWFKKTTTPDVDCVLAHFEVKQYRGQIFTLLHDIALNTFNLNQYPDGFDSLPCSLLSDSISAIEIDAKIILSYMPALNQSDPDAFKVSVWPKKINYIELNLDTTLSSQGEIANTGGVFAFDMCKENDIVYLYYSLRGLSGVFVNSNQSFNTGPSGDNIDQNLIVARVREDDFYLSPESVRFSVVQLYPMTSWSRLFSNLGQTDALNDNDSPLGTFFTLETGPKKIKANYNQAFNKTVLSLISQHGSLPLVSMGVEGVFKDISIPPFFNLAYAPTAQRITYRPLESLSSCLYHDGFIHSVATTIQPERNQTVLAMNFLPQPNAELMLISPEMYDSPRANYIEKSSSQDFYGFRFVESYQPEYRYEPFPILQSYKGNESYQYRKSTTLPTFSNLGTPRPFMDDYYVSTLDLHHDRQMLSLCVGSYLSTFPSVYCQHTLDRFPFAVPLDQSITYITDAYQTANTPSGPYLSNAFAQDNCLVVPTTSGADLIEIEEDDSFFPRDNLQTARRGRRVKLLADCSLVGADGFQFATQFRLPSESFTTSIGADFRVLIERPSDLTLTFQYLEYDPVANTSSYTTLDTYTATSNDLEIHMMGIVNGNDSANYAICIKESRILENDQNYSSLYTNEVYYKSFSRMPYRNPSLIQTTKVESLSNTPSSSSLRVYELGLGRLNPDRGISRVVAGGDTATFLPNLLTGRSPKPQTDIPVFTRRIDHTQIPLNLSQNRTRETSDIYWNNGFIFFMRGQSFKTSDQWTLQRTTEQDINQITSTNLHGRYRTSSNNTTLIWADAQDNGQIAFTVNACFVKGLNVPAFEIIGRNNTSEPWIRLSHVSTSKYGFRAVSRDESISTLVQGQRMPQTRAMRATEANILNRHSPVIAAKRNKVYTDFANFPAVPTFHAYADSVFRAFPTVQYRFIGIRVPSQYIPSTGLLIESLDFGYLSQIPMTLPPSDSALQQQTFDQVTQDLTNNQTISTSYRNEKTAYSLEYSIQKSKSFVVLKSLLSKTSFTQKPVWVINDLNDPFSSILCLFEGSFNFEPIIDDGEKTYRMSVSLTSVE